MLISVVSFLFIFLFCYWAGDAGLFLLSRVLGRKSGFRKDEKTAAGMLLLTVACEWISLFHGIDAEVTAAVLIAVLLIEIVHVRSTGKKILPVSPDNIKSFTPQKAVLLFLMAAAVVFFSALASLTPSSYDDYLYHIQALRWMIEYPAVKGLANLHCRLGYNSSFFALQALFSFEGIFGEALHSFNAAAACFLMCRCIGSFSVFRTRSLRPQASDLVRFTVLLYILTNSLNFSGLDTDPPAMLLVLYIVLEWMEMTEEDCADPEREGFLCLLAAFACTVKLSAAPVLLLAVCPVISFIQTKDVRRILVYVFAGLATALPFFVRNVVLTGYLLYPFPALDFFNVPWKVPEEIARGDAEGIVIWGRSLEHLLYEGKTWQELTNMPLFAWLPEWFSKLALTNRIMLLIDTAVFTAVMVSSLLRLAGRKNDRRPGFLRRTVFFWCTVFLLLYWLFSAPIERYGSVYLFLVPISSLLMLFDGNHRKGEPESTQIVYAMAAVIYSLLIVLKVINLPVLTSLPAAFRHYAVMPSGYAVHDMTAVGSAVRDKEGENCIFYIPAAGDQSDYVHFPAAQNEGDLEKIRFLGENIVDGLASSDPAED